MSPTELGAWWQGFAADITRDKPVRDGEDVNGIAATIREEDDSLTSVIVLGWQPFEQR